MKKTEALFKPVRTAGTPENRFYDFGKHYFAILEIEAECIYQEEKISLNPGTNRIAMRMSHPGYNGGTMKLDPEAVPFRYAEVRGCKGPIQVFQHAFFGMFDDDASDFFSSSENLNRIWELCKHTMKATSLVDYKTMIPDSIKDAYRPCESNTI